MTTAFTISHTIDQEIINDLEVQFDDFRNRIAMLSFEACGTLTGVYSVFTPPELCAAVAEISEETLIDVGAMEREQVKLERHPTHLQLGTAQVLAYA